VSPRLYTTRWRHVPVTGENPQSSSKLIEDLQKLVAAIAGTAALIFITGGLALGARMAIYGLPESVVVGQLPRDWLFSLGLGGVIFPALLAGALYAAGRLVIGTDVKPPSFRRWRPASKGTRLRFIGLLVGGSILLAAPATYEVAERSLIENAWIAGIFVISLATTYFALNARARIADRNDTQDEYNRLPVLFAMIAVVTAWAIPGALMTQATLPLLDAQVCAQNGVHYKGWLLGESENSVYIGENVVPHRVVAIPRDQIEETYSGDGATTITCRKQSVGETK
jgi:hypothetical protein